MSIMSIDDIVLRDGLSWSDRWDSQSVSQNVVRTLGGTPVIFTGKFLKGQSITLESGSDEGYQTYDAVLRLRAKSEQVGGVFEFHCGVSSTSIESYKVMFRHNERPAFKAEPAVARLYYSPTDLFLVTIKLIVV